MEGIIPPMLLTKEDIWSESRNRDKTRFARSRKVKGSNKRKFETNFSNRLTPIRN